MVDMTRDCSEKGKEQGLEAGKVGRKVGKSEIGLVLEWMEPP